MSRGKTVVTCKIRVADSVTLNDIRAFVNDTKEFDGEASFAIEVEEGQRGASYYYLVTQEER